MVCIYVLELTDGKYYVGKTNNPSFRLQNHFDSCGTEWTKKYKPIRVIELRQQCDNYDEDKVTRQYMDKYGIDNVRGGSFVSIKLDNSTINVLKQMNKGTNDLCFICGKKGHFAKNCKSKYIWECLSCGKNFDNEEQAIIHEDIHCSSKDSINLDNSLEKMLFDALYEC